MLGDYRYPHNIAIEFLIEYGMVGALSFSLIAFTSIKKSVQFIRNIDVNYYLKSIVLGWIFYFIAVMFSGSLLSNYEFFIYSGLIVGISRFNNEYN